MTFNILVNVIREAWLSGSSGGTAGGKGALKLIPCLTPVSPR